MENKDAAFACALLFIATLVSFISLLMAFDSVNSFVTVVDSDIIGVSKLDCIFMPFVAVIAAFCGLYYSGVLSDKEWSFFDKNVYSTIVVVAVRALVLLGRLIWLTGGPTKSWFTTLLLVLVPLLILLKVVHPQILVPYLFGVIIVYITSEWFPGREIKIENELMYKWWYAGFVCLAVFLPSLLGIFNNQNTERPLAISVQTLEPSEEKLNNESSKGELTDADAISG